LKVNKKMVVYFGAAGSGLAYCEHSGIVPDIFVDNDSSKWGTLVKGVAVKSPDTLSSISIEQISITSSYVKEIYSQILNFGINRNKIHIPPKSLIEFHIFKEQINRVQTAIKLNEVMEKFNNKFKIVAVGGTALGFVRSGDFIHWDGDIDLFAPINSKSTLFDFLKGLGYLPNHQLVGTTHSITFTLILENDVRIPSRVNLYDSGSDVFTDTFEEYTWEWPTIMFTQCAKVEVHGKQMNVPNPPDEYLNKVYGPSWPEPNPEFGYSDYNGTTSND